VRRYLAAAALLCLPVLAAASDLGPVQALSGPGAAISRVQVTTCDGRPVVRGELRLFPDPLPRSAVGRVVLEAVSGDHVVARADTVVYRLVTADRRARVFGFRGGLPAGIPEGVYLRVRHVPPAGG